MEQERTARIIDISLPVSAGMVVYPGDAQVEVAKKLRLEAGDPYNLTVIRMGAHAGTHLDAPNHFIAEGAEVQDVSLEALVGRARVLDWGDLPSIDAPRLAARGIRRGERVLFKTTNSNLYRLKAFSEDYVYLTPAGAAFLREAGVALVGIDYLSIEGFAAAEPGAHLELLGSGIPVLEGLDLSEADEGEYWMAALPLRLVGAEGAPVRAILYDPGIPCGGT